MHGAAPAIFLSVGCSIIGKARPNGGHRGEPTVVFGTVTKLEALKDGTAKVHFEYQGLTQWIYAHQITMVDQINVRRPLRAADCWPPPSWVQRREKSLAEISKELLEKRKKQEEEEKQKIIEEQIKKENSLKMFVVAKFDV